MVVAILLTDTVGFIQKLPTTLIAAFRATLEEITEANLLLHVVDITHENVQAQSKAVENTLLEINANHVPVLTVLNKIDKLPNPQIAQTLVSNYENAVAISALTGMGTADLLSCIQEQLFENYRLCKFFCLIKKVD